MLSLNPSLLEQEMLEHVNRMRMDPQGELAVLFTSLDPLISPDANVNAAINYFNDPTPQEIQSEWATLVPVAPLAWHESLYNAAFAHSELIVQFDQQSHQLPGEPSLGDRITNAGYPNWSHVAENVFAFAQSVFHGHSAFVVDWAVPSRGHRNNVMSSGYREIGIGIVPEDNPATGVGPLVVTQDFGDRYNFGDAYVLGVVFEDTNENGRYDAGEGHAGVNVELTGAQGTFTATTMTAGGYQVQTPDGTYTLTASGPGLSEPRIVNNVVLSGSNVKVDVTTVPAPEIAVFDGAVEILDDTGSVDFGPTVQGHSVSKVFTVRNVGTDTMSLESISVAPGSQFVLAAGFGASTLAPEAETTFTISFNASAPGQFSETVSFGNNDSDENPFSFTIGGTVAEASVLGSTDFAQLSALDPAGGDLWYRLQTTHEALLSLDASFDDQAGTAGLTLYDENLTELATSSLQNGDQRIDYQAGGAGETYYFRLAGTNTDVDLRVANLLNHAGATVTVHGTNGDDQFQFAPVASYRVTVNGVVYDFALPAVALVTFAGGPGNDSATLTGSTGDETATIRPDSATLTGSGIEVTVTETSNITAHGGGGADIVSLYDSAGDDTFVGDSTQGQLSAAGFTSTAVGFPTLHVYANSGGSDVARLYDSAGDDVLTAKPTFAKLTGDGFFLRVKFFEQVYGYASDGHDVAHLTSTGGNTTFTATPTSGTFTGEGFYNRAESFDGVHAYARGGGYDVATLYDSAGDDNFVGDSTYGKLYGDGFLARAKFFDVVYGLGTSGGHDTAVLYDSAGDDTFTARADQTDMSGSSFHNEVRQFDVVYGYATSGGHDVAHLYDTVGDDTFIVTPGDGKLYGPGYYSRAIGFDAAHAYATGGGHDVAHLYDSAGDDTFVGRSTWSKLSGAGYFSRAKFFEAVHAYGASGGHDTATLYDSAGDDTFIGRPTWSKLYGDGYLNRVKLFEEVYAQGGAGGSDSADLYDSSGDDLLESDGDWARLWSADPAVDFLYEAIAFQSVRAVSTTGNDVATVAPAVDFLLLEGNWQ